MLELTAEILASLYLEERLSESEIALRFGTYQVRINRLRKRWGIPTVTRTDRVSDKLPVLTHQQEQLVVGSLLGDGWMDRTSSKAARFSDGHCQAQAQYTDWKADIMEPFTSNRRWGRKVVGDKTFHNHSFTTSSCRQLLPFYDLFYKTGVRVFPASLPKLMTPLVLAIWYMDDGSLCSSGRNTRISFGLDALSLKRALKALRKLGLEPKVYGGGSDQVIHFMGQTQAFLGLVSDHVPACMEYKLPVETPRQVVDRNARGLTPEKVLSLSTGGLSNAEIAEMYGVGVSTIRRRLQKAGAPRRKPGPKSGRLSAEAVGDLLTERYPNPSEWNTLDEGRQIAWIDDVLVTLRRSGFPYPQVVPLDLRDRQLTRLRSLPADLSLARSGLKLCYGFFPNRYKAKYLGRVSAWEAWFLDPPLRAAIRWQFKVGDPVTPSRVLRAVSANVRTPTVFRPAVAKALYQRYCVPGGRVWDPCAGFGGRLVGAVAAGVQYVGTDVAPETVEGNRQLAHWLGVTDTEIHLAPAETFDPPEVGMVFTSPPYFHQEQYEGGQQSWSSYLSYTNWLDGFLDPVVQRGAAALSSGGHWVMNIADVKYKGCVYPLVESAKDAFRRANLLEVAVLQMPLSNLNRRTEGEPVLVWQKR